ncbi:MAG: cysteine peptidase family C39 domain-containing protein, partial [Planctomycetota bacterium]
WMLGYFLPFSLVIMMVLARYNNELIFVRPFSWIVAGRMRFVILAFAITMGLTVPLSRLPRRFEKILVCILMAGVVIWHSVLPFLVPALIKDHLSNIQTRLSYNGNCFQSTDYTCGPAAAVTALGKLGLPAEEGEIAVLSHTSPVAGTLPDCLSSALQNRYGAAGLRCKYRHFDSIEQLKKAGITLAMVRNSFLLDHCLAVLKVSDNAITVADPVAGMMSISHEQFRKIWRFSGIVLERDRSQSI